ncbi:MAG: hypothetical protein HY826_00590 [Actinobacteria bacterium]|nr:hypothetical protein [Actinomycetota bacterium]
MKKAAESSDDEVRDELPDELNAAAYAGPYEFPDNSRRRKPGVMYLVFAVGCAALWTTRADESALVNDGFLWAAVLLAVVGAYSLTSGWRMKIDEKQALVAAQGAVGFAVGHASAQQVWRGLRSRPTWRVLIYSAEEPPRRRGLVLVDAVDGRVVEHLVQENPVEEWDI